MIITPITTRVFTESEDLVQFIRAHVKTLRAGSIVAVASKIVALSQGRTLPRLSERAKEALIRRESDFALRTPLCWLTVKNGMLIPSAGIDESNANGRVVLLPLKPYRAAEALRKSLLREYDIAQLGVVITDSMIIPLRAGVLGIAVAYSGFRGVHDYRGKKDLFGRPLKITMTNVADSIATAATLTMGEGAETQPLAIVEDAPVFFCNRTKKTEIVFEPNNDLFKPFFDALHATKPSKRQARCL